MASSLPERVISIFASSHFFFMILGFFSRAERRRCAFFSRLINVFVYGFLFAFDDHSFSSSSYSHFWGWPHETHIFFLGQKEKDPRKLRMTETSISYDDGIALIYDPLTHYSHYFDESSSYTHYQRQDKRHKTRRFNANNRTHIHTYMNEGTHTYTLHAP